MIVVSRSHAGDVSKVVQKSVPQAKVENAGGAGKEYFILFAVTLCSFFSHR